MSKLYYYVMAELNGKDVISKIEGYWPNQVLVCTLSNGLVLRYGSSIWIRNPNASPPNYMTCLSDNISWWQWLKLIWKLDGIKDKAKEKNYYNKKIEEKNQFEKFQERAFNESSV